MKRIKMESDEDRGNIDRIPPELWIEILVRVAPRMVVPLKLVCKTFNTIISDHNFPPLHNKTFGTNQQLIRVVWMKLPPTYDVRYGRSLYSYVNLQQFRTIQLPIASKYPYKTQVAGNVNGLLLLHQFKSSDFKWNPCNTLLLWNPLTRQLFHIPNSPLSRITNRSKQVEVAFGYDPVHDDYKIVVFILKPKFQLENSGFLDPKHSAILEIFSLRTKSWRLRVISEIAEIAHFCLGPNIYFNGELHWVVGNELFPVDADVDAAFADAVASGAHQVWASPYYGVGEFTSLMSFNLETEIFTYQDLPDQGSLNIPTLYEGSVSIISIHPNKIGIWKLDKANSNSWTPATNHNYDECWLYGVLEFVRVESATFMVTDEQQQSVLFRRRNGRFITFSIGENKIRSDRCAQIYIGTYVESLLSPSYPFAANI